MKRYICAFVSILLLFSFSICSVSAQTSTPDSTVEIMQVSDDIYLEIVTTVSSPNVRASQKYVTRTYTYKKLSGTKLVAYELKGWFDYDGSTSEATAVEATAYLYESGWGLTNHLEYCSGRSVYGAARFDGPNDENVTLTGSITCDKDGNIT